jgi:hypothetical protein
VDISSLIKEVSGEGTSVIGCTLCINKASLCSINNCVGRFSDVPSRTDGQIKRSVELFLHRPAVKITFPSAVSYHV